MPILLERLRVRRAVREVATPEDSTNPSDGLTASQRRSGQRLMTLEGSLWAVMNSITGGAVVTAFALYLQADGFTLGLLSALPLVAALVQLWTPQMVAKLGSRRLLATLTLGLARLLNLPLIGLAVAAWWWPEAGPLWLVLFLAIVTLSAAFTAIGGTTWLSWAGTVVPIEQRASYFARRNTYIGAVGLGGSLLIGFFLDWWIEPTTNGGHRTHPSAYVILFAAASLFGLITVFLLRRTPDLPGLKNAPRPRFMDSLRDTWQHIALRRFLLFRSAWMFAVGLAVPYYTVYMLKELHLSFTETFALQNIGVLAGLLLTPWWGRLLERFGCSRILLWTSWAKVFYVMLWVLVTPGDGAFWWLAVLFATTTVDAGLNLAAGNLLMNLMPDQNAKNVGYLSVFTAITSLISAIGPFVAGIIVGLTIGQPFLVAGITLGAIQLIFLISGICRAASLLLFRGINQF